jgi:hypothetical protein
LGKPQIVIEESQNDFQALLTMDFYNEKGKHIAKLRRNSWVFNDGNYEITTNPKSLKLIDKETKELIMEINVENTTTVRISNAKFYTSQGQICTITPNTFVIGGLTMSGNKITNCNVGIGIG